MSARAQQQQHLQAINSLRQAFSAPLPVGDTACAGRLLVDVMAFEGDWWAGVRDIQLASAVGQLAQQLAAVAQPTADALEAAAAAGEAQACEALLLYAQAALFCASFCAAAARSGQWQQWPAARNDLFRVLTAAKVAMIAGRRSLLVQVVQLSQAQCQASSGPAAPAVATRRGRLMDTAAVQLDIMQLTMGWLASPVFAGQLPATFASAVAPPQLLLPWITTMRQALSEACAHGTGDRDPILEFVHPFSGLLAFLVGSPAYARHQEELTAAHACVQRQALAHAALCCLPLLADALEQHFGAGSAGGGSMAVAGGSSGGGTGSSGEAAEQAGSPGGSSGVTSTLNSSGSSSEAAEYGSRAVSALTMLSEALDADSVQLGFDDAALTIGDLLNGLRAGARIALALPLDAPPGVPQVILSLAHLAVAQCMATTAAALLDRPQIAAVWEQRNSGDSSSQQPAAEDAGWQALRVLPRLAVVLPRLAAAHPGDSMVDRLVGLHVSAMQLPHLIGDFCTADEAAQWATAAEAALQLLPLLASLDSQAAQQGGQAGGLQQAAEGGWSADGGEESNAGELAGYLLTHVWHGGAARLSRWAKRCVSEQLQSLEAIADSQQQQQGRAPSGEGGSEPQRSGSLAPVPTDLTLRLLRLHMTTCRLFALGSAAPAPMQRWWLEKRTKLAAGLNVVLAILRVSLVEFGNQEPLSEWRFAGAHSAHLVALEPMLDAVAGLPSGDTLHLSMQRSMPAVLLDAAACAPKAACLLDSEEWMGRFCWALDAVAEYNSFNGAAHCLLLVPHCFWTGCCFWVLRTPFCVQDGDISCDARLQVVAKAVQGLDSKPRLVARLAASGGLAAAAQHALRLALSCGAEEEARCTFELLAGLLVDIMNAADQLATSRAGQAGAASERSPAVQASSTPQQEAAADEGQLAAAVAFQQAYNALPADFVTAAACLPALADMFTAAASAAGRVASLLLEAWAAPEQQAAQQLALAQAAATRSCAYLRCANLGGEGGPFAGQGVGSKRCSACRTVWYCGTACSHADWRARHKRVCKALAAARQAEKAAARQQQS